MLWIKSFHIIFMVTWFAGLFYLPRLFVYHSMAVDKISIDRFIIMERKLLYGIMTPGGILTIAFGFWLMFQYNYSGIWLYLKILCVFILSVYHLYCFKYFFAFSISYYYYFISGIQTFMKNILISGSLAYDSIMVFQDYFKNHILPDQIHKLSVSFFVPELKRNFGGTAGNIAYNLSLLNSSAIIMATVGEDFSAYEKRLSKFDIVQDYIKVVSESLTAQAYITTDLDDNQITAFHPGAMMESHQNSISSVTEKVDLAIIAPSGKEGMIKHAQECSEKKIPFIFDPGQGLPMFDKIELNAFIDQATYIAVNDYEAELLMKVSGLSISEIQKKVEAFIITKGAHGSEIYCDNKITIAPIKAESTIDPTGCGDAYRAGLLYGISNKFSWEDTGKLASVMGSIKIKTQGGQNHNPSLSEIEGLFGKKLI